MLLGLFVPGAELVVAGHLLDLEPGQQVLLEVQYQLTFEPLLVDALHRGLAVQGHRLLHVGLLDLLGLQVLEELFPANDVVLEGVLHFEHRHEVVVQESGEYKGL